MPLSVSLSLSTWRYIYLVLFSPIGCTIFVLDSITSLHCRWLLVIKDETPVECLRPKGMLCLYLFIKISILSIFTAVIRNSVNICNLFYFFLFFSVFFTSTTHSLGKGKMYVVGKKKNTTEVQIFEEEEEEEELFVGGGGGEKERGREREDVRECGLVLQMYRSTFCKYATCIYPHPLRAFIHSSLDVW